MIEFKSILEASLKPISTKDYLSQCLTMSSDYVYRGQGDYKWKLAPSAYRGNGVKPIPKDDREDRNSYFLGERFLEDFDALHTSGLDRELIVEKEQSGFQRLQKMVLFQHFGIPTPLLDWTDSPLVALFMATAFRQRGGGRIRIFRLNQVARPEEVILQRYENIGFERIRKQLGGVSFIGEINDSGNSLNFKSIVMEEFVKRNAEHRNLVQALDVKINKGDVELVDQALRNNGFTMDKMFPNSAHWAGQAIASRLPWRK